MTHVKPARQNGILTAMKGYKDYSVPFARSLILKTPPHLPTTMMWWQSLERNRLIEVCSHIGCAP